MAIEKMKALFSKKEAVASVPVKVVPVPKKKAAVKKVATKKAPAKKVATKTTVAKKTAAKKVSKPTLRLVVASDSQSFWVQDGQVLNSLLALEMALKTMKPAVYAYHTSGDSNHFADWVEVVLGDSECATDLRNATTKTAAHRIVLARTKLYSA
jgi:phage-related protein